MERNLSLIGPTVIERGPSSSIGASLTVVPDTRNLDFTQRSVI